MKLSEIPWPGRVLTSNFDEDMGDDELAIELPGSRFMMTIYREFDEHGEEDMSVVVRNYDGRTFMSMQEAYGMRAAHDPAEGSNEHDPKCSRYNLTSTFELLAAVDYFAQKFGTNPPE